MAEVNYISKIVISGVTKYVKDIEAHQRLDALVSTTGGGISYIGVTTTPLADDSRVTSLEINSQNITAKRGDLVIYEKKEFIYDGTAWHEFGDMGSLKSLAFKDSASTQYTPAGNIVLNGATGVDYTPAGTISGTNLTLSGGDSNKLNTVKLGVESTTVKEVKKWNAGSMFNVQYDQDAESITFVDGVLPSLETDDSQVAKQLINGASDGITVATGSISSNGEGDTVVTSSPTSGTIESQTFVGTPTKIGFSGITDTITVQ